MSSSHARLFRWRGSRSRTPRPGPGLLSVPAGLAGRLEHAEKLDRVTQPLAEAIRSGLPTGAKASALSAASLLARMAGRDGGGGLLALGGLAAATTGGFLGRHLAFGLGAGASHAEPITHLTALGWHDLCRIYELPDGRLTRRRLGYLTLTMLRLGGDVLALADQCAHLGGPLHQGSLTEDGAGPCVTCPWHGST